MIEITLNQKQPSSTGTYTYDENIKLQYEEADTEMAVFMMNAFVDHSGYPCEATMTMKKEAEDVRGEE